MNSHCCPLNLTRRTWKGSEFGVWFDVKRIAHASLFTCGVVRNVTISSTNGTLWAVKRCTLPNKYFIWTVASSLGDMSGCVWWLLRWRQTLAADLRLCQSAGFSSHSDNVQFCVHLRGFPVDSLARVDPT